MTAAVERAANGLRIRGHGLYLEPRGRPPLGFVAHARAPRATLPERTIATAATVALLEAAQPRSLRKANALAATYGQPFALGSLRLTLHPAGHVLGSAQIRCEAPGVDVVYAADLGGDSLTAEKREQLECETLVMRATYGHPRYVFPPRSAALAQVERFVEAALKSGATPVLVAAAVGASQELVRHFAGRGRVPRLHPAAHRACGVYGLRSGFVRLQDEGDVVVVPPGVRIDRLGLSPLRTCAVTGHALDGRFDADEAIALSDHADFRGLVEYVTRSKARRVYLVHGYVDELAAALRAKGIVVEPLRDHHQLRLPGF